VEATQLSALEQALMDGGSSRLGLLLLHLERRRQLQAHLGLARYQRLLHLLCERLQRLLRPQDQVLAGAIDTEIVLLLPDLLSPGHAQMAAQRILREFDQPVEIEGQPIRVTGRSSAR
jgi:GGDEF domain-containing protein